jgi:hypothetical protein
LIDTYPFVLSLLKRAPSSASARDTPFDKLKANGAGDLERRWR